MSAAGIWGKSSFRVPARLCAHFQRHPFQSTLPRNMRRRDHLPDLRRLSAPCPSIRRNQDEAPPTTFLIWQQAGSRSAIRRATSPPDSGGCAVGLSPGPFCKRPAARDAIRLRSPDADTSRRRHDSRDRGLRQIHLGPSAPGGVPRSAGNCAKRRRLHECTPIRNFAYMLATFLSQSRTPVSFGIHSGASMATTVERPAWSSVQSTILPFGHGSATASTTSQWPDVRLRAHMPDVLPSDHARSMPSATSAISRAIHSYS